MPTNFELKQLKPKLDIAKKPENRVHELTDFNVSLRSQTKTTANDSFSLPNVSISTSTLVLWVLKSGNYICDTINCVRGAIILAAINIMGLSSAVSRFVRQFLLHNLQSFEYNFLSWCPPEDCCRGTIETIEIDIFVPAKLTCSKRHGSKLFSNWVIIW